MIKWEPYAKSIGKTPRIRGVCCCDAYEFVCEGGHYLILRRNPSGDVEEAARGRHVQARAAWHRLLAEHAAFCEQGSGPRDIWLA
ncbi:hypothetical protein HCN51_52685 [Nonomuraea sp. FMUSA5-5]|uniref:Uncharacterized protein n=1 Tax=Nonomuraea composti TaxID=2720023 RepID=A0ABX1BJU0_9ACTN|nr:hypothetical protein [Nonomuraea sp. FMUSA5-5]NJP97991.1 hypothetical protein [Nonomuraea sp. FMUSA5-5]